MLETIISTLQCPTGQDHSMIRKRLVVYTAIFGGFEDLLPQRKFKDIDYIAFSDQPLKSRTWTVRKFPSLFSDSVRCAKEFKILPHRFFPEYEYSIWIDGNYLVVGDVGGLLDRVLKHKNMAVFDHNQTVNDARGCLYREFEEIMALGRHSGRYKDNPDVMRHQIARYRTEGYPENNGLVFASILVRRHNQPDVIRTMEHWWNEIQNGSRRDQLSFNYSPYGKTILIYKL